MTATSRRWGGRGTRGAAVAALAAALWAGSRGAQAQQTQDCPIGAADQGFPIQRTFTDSAGRMTEVFLQIPPGHDPDVPTGVLMYFHGNDHDPDDSYFAPLYELTERADAHGLIAAGLKSIGTRMNDDGTISREWLNTDMRLLHELLLSDFGGCFKLDRSRVYLEGASQGTCFLSAVLTDWAWRDFAGGVIGLCGCWGFGNFDYPVDVPTLRNRFKVFVENTTEDFLYPQGVIGLDAYKYNFGLDVRADLNRPGEHCSDARVNAAAALDWMLDGADYPDPDADVPHWQVLDTRHNGLEDVDYDANGQRFVVATQRPNVGDELIEEIEQVRWSMFADDPPGFLEWRLANYPEYDQPPLQILVSADYGASFERVALHETSANNNLHDLVVAPDGSILVAVGLGVQKVDEAAGTLEPFAHEGMLVYGLDRDDSGNLFAHGAVIQVQRSPDSGASWTELAVPVLNQNAQHVVGYNAGYLVVIGGDGKLRYSQDAGDNFDEADLPAGTLVDFAHHGATFYAVSDTGTLNVSLNAGASWQPAPTPTGTVLQVKVMPDGDAIIEVEWPSIAYRSSDQGQTWERERGAHNAPRMDFAHGPGGQVMMVTTRGILRHSSGDLLDLGTPLPPLTPRTMGGAGGGSGSGEGGSGGGAGAAGMAQAGAGAAGAGGSSGAGGGGAGAPAAGSGGASGAASPMSSGSDDSGCGCRVGQPRPSQAARGLALLALSWLALRRRRRLP